MSTRDSFSRLREKLLRRRSDRSGTDAGGERVDPTDPPVRPDSHIMAGSHDDGDVTNTDASGWQARLAGLPPQPDDLELVPARASRDVHEGREADADEREVGQSYSDLHPPVEVVIGSESSREGGGADEEKVERNSPSPPTPSVPHIPDGT